MTLPRKSKEFIASLINYFEQERDNGGPLLPLSAVREVSVYYLVCSRNKSEIQILPRDYVLILTESCCSVKDQCQNSNFYFAMR